MSMFRSKGDVQNLAPTEDKAMSHTWNFLETLVEVRLYEEVVICEHQYCFMSKEGTTAPMSDLRYRDQREYHCVFVDLERP